MLKQITLACVMVLALASLPATGTHAVENDWETTTVQVNGMDIKARIANTYNKRVKGLMGVESLPKDEGMLFVFDRPGAYCMWMSNTLIPLTVIYLDEKGEYIDHLDLTPHDLTHRCTKGQAKYALEINQGLLPVVDREQAR